MGKTLLMPYDNTENTRYNSADFRELYGAMFSNGILVPAGENVSTSLACKVTKIDATTVKASAGGVFINGAYKHFEDTNITLDTDGTYKAVAEYSEAGNGIILKAIQGDLSKTSTLYQIQLATVVKSGTTLTIIDTRSDPAVCGFVNKIVSNNCNEIQGTPVLPTAPTEGQMLICKDGKYEPGKIIDSGSNANGSFIKFSDGTMICKTYVASQTTDSTGRVTWTFPAAFLTGEIPTVTVSTVASLSSTQNAIIGTTPTPTGVVFLHTMNGAAINAQAVRYCATAIGKWK